ncbi:MAG: hypothetical protein KAQ96_02925, partial [Thermoplasmata archaeon]|nr:hypothetical protein [Thermoplasmata archaeon]
EWGERHFAERAAFTLTFFIVSVLLYVYYRILYADLLFEDRPFLSIALPALVIALMVGWGVKRAM